MNSHYQGPNIKLPVFGQIPLSPIEIWNDLKKREGSPLWAQFAKYILFGLSSLALFFSTFQLVETIWPNYLNRELLSPSDHQSRMSIVLAFAFFPANFFAYYTNRTFVFTPGKHSFKREFCLFMLISAISFIGGEVGKRWIISLGYPNILAALSFAFSSAIINFIARKLVVFKS